MLWGSFFISFALLCFFEMNGWPKCIQKPNIYNVHLTWRMINIFHAVVLSWIKKKKHIRVHILKYVQNETEYCKLGPYFESSLNNNSCVQVTFFFFLYCCHLTTLAFKPLKRLYILQDNFCNSNPRIKSYHSSNEIDLVFYLHLYQITQL